MPVWIPVTVVPTSLAGDRHVHDCPDHHRQARVHRGVPVWDDVGYGQGEFPWQNLLLDGYERTSPVGRFRPNGYGLADMAGNVWEWTSDLFTLGRGNEPEHLCCAPRNPRVAEPDPSFAHETIPRRVTKGGSHLCAPNYCLRYRPAARQGEAVDTPTGHIGFRCVVRV